MKTLTFTAIALAAWVALSAANAHEFKVGAIGITQPYARAMLPGAKVGSGYLTIANEGDTSDRFVGATSNRAGSIQLHEMKIDNGVMVMRELANGIPLPVATTVQLKPGGLHLMFMDVRQPFRPGEEIKATLTFEKAGAVDVRFTVGPPSGETGGSKRDPHSPHADDTDSKTAGAADSGTDEEHGQ
ncbi:copper chaperone PCu(A)C [Ensifer adhaerens]|uniref:copper chaperone PCu(A)C n=1 Tax=Ensifer adhaerens TaxID=106592 RepID=UPI003D05A0C5